MKVRMYSIYDKKTQLFGFPQYCHNAAQACRMFTGVFLEPQNMMARFPEDYDIYDLGEFDDNSGTVTSDKPTFICSLKSLNKVNSDINGKEEHV